MIVGVVGGRKFTERRYMEVVLDRIKPTMIVSGGAKGADTLAYNYAVRRGITFVCHPPLEDEKRKLGYAGACNRRNLRIVEQSDVLVAFPDVDSKGTWHAIKLAKELGKKVAVFDHHWKG